MKLNKKQEAKLKEMAYDEAPNQEIAEKLGIALTDVYAARSRLGITIPKIKEAKVKNVQVPAKRSKEEIIEEMENERKAWKELLEKGDQCQDRLDQLFKELLEV